MYLNNDGFDKKKLFCLFIYVFVHIFSIFRNFLHIYNIHEEIIDKKNHVNIKTISEIRTMLELAKCTWVYSMEKYTYVIFFSLLSLGLVSCYLETMIKLSIGKPICMLYILCATRLYIFKYK